MAMQINIAGTTILMNKFFSGEAAGEVASFVATAEPRIARVVFVDTPATPHLVGLVRSLLDAGREVVIRDHHDIPNPGNSREQEIHGAAEELRLLLGDNAQISDRGNNPACSSLITEGEFVGRDAPVTLVVADPDPDGLTAAMKGLGVVYPELDLDAAVLDGPRTGQSAETLSPLAWLLVQGMATLPPFDADRPHISERAKSELFGDFVAIVAGCQAKAKLAKAVEVYEAGVAVAKELATKITHPVAGVSLVDSVGSPRFDLGTLARAMEANGEKVTVVRKDVGPIAKACGGVQYSLAVVRKHQAEVNLQELLPEGFSSNPEVGIISNTTFLLHVSQEVWDTQVLPALRARFEA